MKTKAEKLEKERNEYKQQMDKLENRVSYEENTSMLYEPLCQKTGLRNIRPGQTQTGLCSNRRGLETWKFGFKKMRICTILVVKTKAPIGCAGTAQLMCIFVFT